MLNKRANIRSITFLLGLILVFIPGASFGQTSVRYGEEIKKEPPVRYGAEIEKRARVRYGVDIRVEDIRQVKPGEIVEEVISDFEFEMRNYIKLSGYYDKLMKYPDINPDNILQLEETAFLAEVNTQVNLTYLEDYSFKADLSYQYSPGSDEQSDRDTHFITNEFFLDLYLAELAYLRVGKKRETWGIGWTFSPVDYVINPPKNLVDPAESREGMYLSMLEIPVGDSSFSFVYFPYVAFDIQSEAGQSGIPEDMFDEEGAYGIRASFLLWDTDISLIYYYTDKIPDLQKNYFGITLNRFWRDLGAYVEVIGHQGNDLERVDKTDIGQNVFWFGDDLVDIKEDDNETFVNFAVGLSYGFPDDSRVGLEYYRNSEGYDDNEFDEFVDFIKHEAEIHRLIQDDFSMMKLLKGNQLLGNRLRKN